MHVSLSHRHDDVDRISPLDLSNLRVEEHGMPMHVAALALLDGRRLLDEAGDVRIGQIRRHVEERIGDAERLHQVLVWPRTRHRPPVWEDDRDFAVASPETEHELSWVARLKGIAAGGAMRVRRGWSVARLGTAPALSWNQPVGSRRALRFVRGDLARAKAVAHEYGGKVNDVVLAAVAGGAYALLESRGDRAPDLDMHVSVAASIRRPGERGGNRVEVRLVKVPVSDPDAVSRLGTIAAHTAAQRRWPPLQPNGRFQQRWVVHVMAHQRLINMVLSNMPGPPVPLWFAGARVQEMFQISPLQGNCAIGVGVLSYAGRLNVDIVADPDVVPDVEVFTNGVAEALEQLGVARTPSRPHAP